MRLCVGDSLGDALVRSSWAGGGLKTARGGGEHGVHGGDGRGDCSGVVLLMIHGARLAAGVVYRAWCIANRVSRVVYRGTCTVYHLARVVCLVRSKG